MPYQDFRQFLDVLRQHGELVDVNRPIALNDVGKAMKQSYVRQGPAIMFNRNGTDYPLVAGVYSTRSKALLAFEADEDTIFDKVLTGLDNPIAPTAVSGKAPCQDEVITGDDIDIRRWPIPTYSPKDGGPYITPGIVVSEDPETGVPDIGHYRFLILGKDTVSFSAQPFHRFGKHLAKHKRMGTVPKAALVIGVDPILAYTCQVQVPDDTNDWTVAGGLRGAPVELARCTTCDLEVPATSEVVIEFEVDLNQTVLEGPLGEYTGYYTRPSQKPVARITAITHLLPGAAHRQADHREPHPQAGAVRSVVLPHSQAPVSDHQADFSAGLRRRVVLRGHRHAAALRGRSAAGDPRGDGEQHPAEVDDHRRSRHRRALFDRSRMGDGLPRAAAA
jgi:2,5-furandicarboxylate decarboxylase 1